MSENGEEAGASARNRWNHAGLTEEWRLTAGLVGPDVRAERTRAPGVARGTLLFDLDQGLGHDLLQRPVGIEVLQPLAQDRRGELQPARRRLAVAGRGEVARGIGEVDEQRAIDRIERAMLEQLGLAAAAFV